MASDGSLPRLPLPVLILISINILFYHGATTLVEKDLLIVQDSWSHSDMPHSVELLWTSDQSDAETDKCVQ